MLTLADKIINSIDAGKSHKAVTLDLNVGHTQINEIMNKHDSIKSMYIEGTNAAVKYLAPRHMLYPEVDAEVWDFFCIARSKNISVNGPMLQSEGNESAMKQNYKFTASNGWLKSFCIILQIKFSTLHSEGAQVCNKAIDQWLQELPTIMKGYELKDIYNCDKTSIFFRALPNKTLQHNCEKPMGNKVSQDRFSLLVCANAASKKEKLLVIGKLKRPHSFPKYNSDLSHHVTYRSNNCGGMTTAIFTEFLNSLNNKMEHQGWHILMFLDNCSSHPHVHLSNVKLVFYLKNTMSRLQAMVQGVIANLRKNYAKRMLNVACMETRRVKNVTEIIREIKIFDAILHAKVATEQVDPLCIIKCFKWSGVLEQENPPSPPTTVTRRCY